MGGGCAGAWSPEKKRFLDRLWCVLGAVSVKKFTKMSLDLHDFSAFHSNFSNQGVRLLTFFLAIDLCRFCVVIHFFHPQQQPVTSDVKGFSIPDFIHYIYFPILILEKEQVFLFLMFSAKQENYWYHFL